MPVPKCGTPVILPSSFTGGPRELQQCYLDAMAIVKKFGKPEDGAPIVRSLISQFPEATFVWLVNKATRQTLESSEQVRIQKVIKLGGVEAVLMHA